MHFPCNFTVDNISTHSLTRRLTYKEGKYYKLNEFQLTASRGG